MSDKGRLFLYDDSFISPPEFNNESENIICFYRMKNFLCSKSKISPHLSESPSVQSGFQTRFTSK